MERTEEPWINDRHDFCVERSVQYVDHPDALNPVEFVYSVFQTVNLDEVSLEGFIDSINSCFSRTETMCKIRDPNESLVLSAGRGMDALSDYLLSLSPSKQQYERVMRSAHRGLLMPKYLRVSSGLT
tara:strand:- start:1267 stop:1647 length:381 start_codon:yes stop_codon:yes gene_type:complete